MKLLWVTLGVYTTVWGAWLFNPFWTVFRPEAGLYSTMADFMPEWAWGLHAIIIGTAILVGVCCAWPRALWWGHIAGVYHWLLIAFFYGLGDWRNTGMITSITIAALFHVAWVNYNKLSKKVSLGYVQPHL